MATVTLLPEIYDKLGIAEKIAQAFAKSRVYYVISGDGDIEKGCMFLRDDQARSFAAMWHGDEYSMKKVFVSEIEEIRKPVDGKKSIR